MKPLLRRVALVLLIALAIPGAWIVWMMAQYWWLFERMH